MASDHDLARMTSHDDLAPMTGAGARADEAGAEVTWRAVWHRGAGWLALGLLLLPAGAIWLWARGASPMQAFADDREAAPALTPVGLLVLPGVACVLLGLRAVVRAKVLLASGSTAAAEVVFTQPLRWRWPARLAVGFCFRERDGTVRNGVERVLAASPTGRAVWRGEPIAVRYWPSPRRGALLVPAPPPGGAR
jgi:hypothetical protein